MKILLITRGIPSPKDPQWGCFEKDQADALTAYGHDVVCISVDMRTRLYWRKIGITHKKIDGIDYYNSFLLPDKFASILGNRIRLWNRRFQLCRLYRFVEKKHGKPDVMYAHYYYCIYNGAILKSCNKIPLVGIEHASVLININEVIETKVENTIKYGYNNADALIAVGKQLQAAIRNRFDVNACVIPNILGKEFLKNQRISECKKRNKVIFISIGTLIPRKGFDSLITAFSQLNAPGYQWELKIVGSGPESDNLQRQINISGLRNKIFLLGKKSKNEIVDLLRDSDVFVLASKSETFGVVVIEAMSMGLPVIATKCGGPEDFVGENQGLLVPVGDVEKLRQAIEYMCVNAHEYDRSAISAECKERFGGNCIAKQLTDVFAKVVKSYE